MVSAFRSGSTSAWTSSIPSSFPTASATAREAAGLTGVWVHDLRRSFVTLASRSGLPESVVARFSGHRTEAVFKRYNIVEEQDLKSAVQVLNRARKAAESGKAPSGHEMDTVDQK